MDYFFACNFILNFFSPDRNENFFRQKTIFAVKKLRLQEARFWRYKKRFVAKKWKGIAGIASENHKNVSLSASLVSFLSFARYLSIGIKIAF
jgi:hypothetical protein